MVLWLSLLLAPLRSTRRRTRVLRAALAPALVASTSVASVASHVASVAPHVASAASFLASR
jgi:hypothetical protein